MTAQVSRAALRLLTALPAFGSTTLRRAAHGAGLNERSARRAADELARAALIEQPDKAENGSLRLIDAGRRGTGRRAVAGPDSVRHARRLIEVLPSDGKRMSLLIAAELARLTVDAAAGAAAWLDLGRLVRWSHSASGAHRLQLRPAGIEAQRQLLAQVPTSPRSGAPHA